MKWFWNDLTCWYFLLHLQWRAKKEPHCRRKPASLTEHTTALITTLDNLVDPAGLGLCQSGSVTILAFRLKINLLLLCCPFLFCYWNTEFPLLWKFDSKSSHGSVSSLMVSRRVPAFHPSQELCYICHWPSLICLIMQGLNLNTAIKTDTYLFLLPV